MPRCHAEDVVLDLLDRMRVAAFTALSSQCPWMFVLDYESIIDCVHPTFSNPEFVTYIQPDGGLFSDFLK